MDLLLFLIIPISSILLLFLKDRNKNRQVALNILLIINAFFFLIPLFLAYSNTPKGESMWNENTGGGAVLWLYLIVFPICAIIQIVLLILKFVYFSGWNKLKTK